MLSNQNTTDHVTKYLKTHLCLYLYFYYLYIFEEGILWHFSPPNPFLLKKNMFKMNYLYQFNDLFSSFTLLYLPIKDIYLSSVESNIAFENMESFNYYLSQSLKYA